MGLVGQSVLVGWIVSVYDWIAWTVDQGLCDKQNVRPSLLVARTAEFLLFALYNCTSIYPSRIIIISIPSTVSQG